MRRRKAGVAIYTREEYNHFPAASLCEPLPQKRSFEIKMVFSSLSFLTLFLPGVLSASWLLGWLARRRGEGVWRAGNAILLLASLLFYFWSEGPGVLLLLASIAANASFGQVLSRLRGGTARRALLTAAIATNLAALVVFKYSGFLAASANGLLGASLPIPRLALPLGISFYTFQAMSYVIDVYRGDVRPPRSPLDFACYIAMFPQLVAGPIVRFSDVAAALRARRVDLARIASGMRRLLAGLAKKVVLANTVADFADRAWATTGDGAGLPPSLAWLALVCYTLQIYFDFSGYSDMAIGIGRMLGFDFPENFNLPYIAKSVREFWRRWHITLSSWFRDYLYIPLGGGRRSPARTSLNVLVVFGLCGLWHGAGTMFLLWGLWHGLWVVAERLAPWRLGETRVARAIAHVRTLAAVMGGWILFRSDSLAEAWLFIRSLAGRAPVAPEARALAIDAGAMLFFAVAAGILLSTGVPAAAWARLAGALRRRGLAGVPRAIEWGALTAAALLALLLIAGGSYNPFIYFRF